MSFKVGDIVQVKRNIQNKNISPQFNKNMEKLVGTTFKVDSITAAGFIRTNTNECAWHPSWLESPEEPDYTVKHIRNTKACIITLESGIQIYDNGTTAFILPILKEL